MSLVLSENRRVRWLSVLFCIAVFCTADQLCKYFACLYLKDGKSHILISKVLELTYIENRGMAFGLLQDRQSFLAVFCTVFLGVMSFVFQRMPGRKKYLPLQWVLILIVSGALGNFLDRVFRGYVVDYIYVSLIRFPVFNLADILVVTGGILLIALIFFYYKEEDFEFLSFHKK